MWVIRSLVVVKETSNGSRFRPAAVTLLLHLTEFDAFFLPRWTETGCLKMSKRTTQQSEVGLGSAAQRSHQGCWGIRKQNPSWKICVCRDVVTERKTLQFQLFKAFCCQETSVVLTSRQP